MRGVGSAVRFGSLERLFEQLVTKFLAAFWRLFKINQKPVLNRFGIGYNIKSKMLHLKPVLKYIDGSLSVSCIGLWLGVANEQAKVY